MQNKLIIFGSAEIAKLAKYYFEFDSDYEVVAFTVDDDYVDNTHFQGLPLIPFSEVLVKYPSEDHDMFVALSYVGLNSLREEKYHQAKKTGYRLANYVCSKSVTWPDLNIGDNCFILENQTIQPSVKIGNNVMLWSGNHLGHASIISDHAYISSHAVISGHCKIGERCFIGVNVTLRDFLTIGNDCFIAMGSSVVRNMEDGSVSVGDSSAIFPKEDRRAKVLKKKLFSLK